LKGLKEFDVKTVRLTVAGLLVVAAPIVLGVNLLGGDGSEESSSGAVALSESELLTKAASLGQAVYWVGPRAGTTSYELTSPEDGRVYIRYLTGDAEAGDPEPNFLTVGTYPVANAIQNLEAGVGGQEKLTQHQGYKVLGESNGDNAYVVFESQPDLQIELFSPQPGEASQLAGSGLLKPLG
jgi:hypothetical protein